MTSVWRPTHLSRAQLEERRLTAQTLLNQGELTTRQIAEYLGVDGSTVRGWKQRLHTDGEHALKARTGGGRPKHLTPDQETRLGELIDLGAVAYGFDNEQWTSPRVRDVIGHEFGVWYHVDHVYKLLIKLGFSLQKPGKTALERDEAAIRTWARTKGTEIRKKSR